MPLGVNFTLAASAPPEPSPLMIPGQREPGPLTRFAPAPGIARMVVDGTLDAPGRADRRREGGGGPGERRAPGISRWTRLVTSLRGSRVRESRLRRAPATEAVALSPPTV